MEVLAFAQLASIVAYFVSIFYVYGILVKSKDAAIEVLKERIVSYEVTVKELREATPDVLVERLIRREEHYKKELEGAEGERSGLLLELAEVRERAGPDAVNKIVELEEQLFRSTAQVNLIQQEREALQDKFQEIESSLSRYVKNGVNSVSYGRQWIISQAVAFLGPQKVIEADFATLVEMFKGLVFDGFSSGIPGFPINQGSLVGLKSVGIVNGDFQLTELGVQVFQKIALEAFMSKAL